MISDDDLYDEEEVRPASPAPRPISPSKPTASRPGGLPAASVPQDVLPVERLEWGSVGSRTIAGVLSDGSNQRAVLRNVEASIRYDPPPLPHVWQPSAKYPQRFEMPWTAGNPAEAESLKRLGDDLRGRRPATYGDPRLARLNEAAAALLRTASELHRGGCRLGLLHPGNVLVVPGSGGKELVLADLGFFWRGGEGPPPWPESQLNRPETPGWIRSNPYRLLWDEAPMVQQMLREERPGRTPQQVEASDVHTLARLLLFVLTGAIHEPGAPSGDAASPVVDVLRSALPGGAIQTVQALAARLKEQPLSHHFLAPPPPPPPRRKASGWLKLTLLAAILLLLAGGLVAMLVPDVHQRFAELLGKSAPTTPTTEPTQPTDPGTGTVLPLPELTEAELEQEPSAPLPASSPLASVLASLPNKPPDQQAASIAQTYEVDLGRLTGLARDLLHRYREHARWQWLSQWMKRFQELDRKVREDYTQTFAVGRQMRALHAELVLVHAKPAVSPLLNEKEQRCLDKCNLRAAEYGSSR